MTQIERLRSWYRGPIPPGRTTPLELLMIQGTRFCNIDCQYCYLPFRTDKSTFDLDYLDALFPKLDEAGLLGGELTLLWHAGEPMVLKPDWYREAFARIDALLAPSGTKPIHNFQTNAILVNDAWIDFFREHQVRVGVSIDGPEDLHDARRTTRDGKGTHAKGLAGLRKLKDAGLNPSAICVLSAEALRRPDEIYDFFRAEGVSTVGFNVEEIEGPNKTSSLAGAEQQAAYRAFLKRMTARGNADRWAMHIRELRTVPLSVFANPPAPHSTEAEPFAILSVDVEGRVFTFSPELVDLTDAEGRGFSIGHVSSIDFRTLEAEPAFARLAGEVRAGIDACRATCGFFDICGGGAPVNKLSENGSFASTETMFCRLTRQTVCEVIEDEIEATIHRRRRIRGVETAAAPKRLAPRQAPVARPATPAPRVSQTPVQPGVALLGEAARPGRIHVCKLIPRHDDPGYHKGGLVPDFEWRAPTPAEDAMLRTRDVAAGPLGFISIVQPPPDLIAPLLTTAQAVADDTPWIEIDPALREAGLESIMSRIGDLYGEGDEGERRLLGVNVSPVGMPTATVEKDGLLLGLHVDSWFRQRIVDRAAAPNRICLNLGREPRYFLFWNLTVMRILALLGMSENEAVRTRNLAHLFFERFPDYPVARLTLNPGECYIAPTELIAHDATTFGRKHIDINTAMLGRFRARPAGTTVIQGRKGAAS